MGHGHGEDFKREAVRLALSSGLSRKRVAADLGIGLSTLGKWIARYRTEDRPDLPSTDLLKEVEQLRHDYQKRLRDQGFQVSMSGKGNCYDCEYGIAA